MSPSPSKQVIQQLRRFVFLRDAVSLTDEQLLDAFIGRRDDLAFETLVRRHGAMVMGVCRRVLGSHHDAEDAFQATFLVLARKASAIAARGLAANWLYGVAFRIAANAKMATARRRKREGEGAHMAEPTTPPAIERHDWQDVLDQELSRLPDKYRIPIVLCDLEEKTRTEAARQMGCPEGTVASRLARGRALLAKRLAGRGVALTAGMLAGHVPLNIASASVPSSLIASTTNAAILYTAGHTLTGVVSSTTLALAERALNAMILTKLKTMALAGLVIGFVALGGGDLLTRPMAAAPGDDKAPIVNPEKPKNTPEQAVKPTEKVDAIGDPLPEAALLRLGTKRFRHPDSAYALALSPDGKTAMTLGWAGLYAWDTDSGKERWHAGPSEFRVDMNPAVGATRLVFCPDGKSCITLADGLSFKTWDVATGNALTTRLAVARDVQPSQLNSLDLAPDGKTLALGGPAGIFVCDRAGTVLARIARKPVGGPVGRNEDRLLAWAPFSFARFAPDGKALAVVESEASDVIKICSAADGSELRRLTLGKRYLDSSFSPDGKLLAVAERDDTIHVYEIQSGKRVHSWAVPIRGANENYIFQVVFSPDGKTVAASSSDKLIRIWDAASGANVGELNGHRWYPWGLAFTADSKVLYSTGWDGDIRRWDLATHKQLPLPFGIRGTSLVAAAPDGRSVVYRDGDGDLRFVGPKDGRELRTLNVPDVDASQLLFAPDGRSLAVGGSNKDKVVTCVVDLPSGKEIRRWEWPKGKDPHASVEELAFTADGRRLAAMSFRLSQAHVWDLREKTEPLVLKHAQGYSLSFSPDGKTLLTAGWDRKLRFWDAAKGTLKKDHLVTPPTQNVPGARDTLTSTDLWAVAFSPDGTRIAAADMNGLLWLWDAESLQVKFVVHTGDIFRVNCLAYSPDGLWLATGGASGRAKVWDALTGQLVWERGAHAGDLYRVCFSRDSGRLLSGAGDGLGYLWDLRPKDLPSKKPRDLWADLIGGDGPVAYGAYWALRAQPATALALLAEYDKQLQTKASAEQIVKWIGDLDSATFAVREAAMADLTRHSQTAAPYMRKELSRAISLEQQRRLQSLVTQADQLHGRIGLIVSLLAQDETPAGERLFSHWASMDDAVGRAAALHKPHVRLH